MSESKASSNPSFARAFLPGLVIGLLIGLAIGAVVPTLLEAPSALGPPGVRESATPSSPRDVRDEVPDEPAAIPAEAPAQNPEQPEPDAPASPAPQ
jgi:hypothetical protein